MIDKLSYFTQCYNIFNKMQIISRADTEGIILNVNQNFCKISAYAEAELIGFSHNKIRHPDMEDIVFERMWKSISNGKIWRGEIKNYTKKRDFYWTKSIIFPIFDDKKNIVEYISFGEDITKKKLLELKETKEDNLRRDILHSQSNMVLLVHKVKGVIFMNNQCFIDLPFTSRVDFLKEHECICELFIEQDGFLKKSAPQRHWLKDFEEFPEKIHSALINNKKGEQQTYHVTMNEFKDNKNLIVVNFLNITEFESCKEELNKKAEILKLIESKIEKELSVEGENKVLIEELKALLST